MESRASLPGGVTETVRIERGPDGERVAKTVTRMTVSSGASGGAACTSARTWKWRRNGVMTKRVTADVKRVGQGASAQAHMPYRDRLATVRLATGAGGGKHSIPVETLWR